MVFKNERFRKRQARIHQSWRIPGAASRGFALPRIKLPEPFGPGSFALLRSGSQTVAVLTG
jgi:hypothetical protein